MNLRVYDEKLRTRLDIIRIFAQHVPLSVQELNKLHPSFQRVVAEKLPGLEKEKICMRAEVAGLDEQGTEVFGAIVFTESLDVLRNAGFHINSEVSRQAPYATLRCTADDLVRLTRLSAVSYITPGEIQYIQNDVTVGCTGADLLHSGYVDNTEFKGSGVIVGIVDTGIDWRHSDFMYSSDPSQSRIIAIWDQTLTPTGSESSPIGFDYGVEYTMADIEDELDGSPTGFVREQDTHGHGTHVIGTAAGNGNSLSTEKYQGMAPEAGILVVKAGNGSFPTTNIIDALTYIKNKSASLGKPVVVNMSLGSDEGPHDGTDPLDAAIDDFSGAGQVCVVSAGNSGDKAIHISGTIAAGNSVDINMTVPFYTAISGANNDDFFFDLWFDNNGSVTAQLTSPNAISYSQGPQGTTVTGTDDGTFYIYNWQDVSNSDREICTGVYDSDASKTPRQGTWTLRLTNNSGSARTYHGWLYDYSIGVSGVVTLTGGDATYTLGNHAESAVIVGSYAHRWRWMDKDGNGWMYSGSDRSDNVSSFSSIGPTRDGRQKPDITAPGQGMVSSLSQDASVSSAYIVPGEKHRVNQGTSMSSPAVAGAVALILEQNSNLSPESIASLIENNADTDAFTGSVWNATWGHGKLDIYKAMIEAVNPSASPQREILAYDGWASSGYGDLSNTQKLAVRFTPLESCRITGAFFHPYAFSNVTGPVYLEVWSDASGLPGSKIGGTVSDSQDQVLPFSWNFVNMQDAGVSLSAGTDYHLVLYYTSGLEMSLMHDAAGSSSRSSFYNGSGWSSYSSGNWRLRPVVANEEGVLVEAKIFLEGAYDTGLDRMRTDNSAYLPYTSPYTEDERAISGIPVNATDWVLVQLKETEDGPTVASKSAFLHRDGRIVTDDGTAGQILLCVPEGSYYIVVRHRNHLAVESASAVALSGGSSTLYDFSTGTNKYKGSDAALLETGVYGLYSGDANGSGIITNSDKDPIISNLNEPGYYDADTNCSGIVTNSDKDPVIRNLNKATAVQ